MPRREKKADADLPPVPREEAIATASSDAVLDELLRQDPNSRVAVECLTTTGTVIVAAGLATRCEVQLSYAIGVAEPTSINVDTFGTATIPEERIVELVRQHFDLRPKAIIEALGLRKPIYRRTAAYGHFGREPEPDGGFSWERTNKAEALKREAGE